MVIDLPGDLPLDKELGSPIPAPIILRVAQFGASHRRLLFPAAHDDAKSPTNSSSPGGFSAGGRSAADPKRFVKLEEKDLQEDWYAFLKLTNGEGSSTDQIRAAYRKRCLETHPDKQPDGSDVEFKKVQRAFDILGNAEARRSYDSSRPFDDSIPPPELRCDEDDDFFAIFVPVFERNKKWSALPDPPSLGDADTPLSAVRKFYDFWLTFRSWRDFSNELELTEIQEGMSREEKRFYLRENQRLLDQRNREEQKRVRMLVDRAMKLDPRLRRHRELEEAARQQLIMQRNAARQAALAQERQAAELAAEQERLAAEEKRQAAIQLKQQRQQNMKEVAEFFRTHQLVDEPETNLLLPDKVRKPNIQWVLANASLEEIVAFRDQVLAMSPQPTPEGVPAVLKFNELLGAVEHRIGRNRYGEGCVSKKTASSDNSKDTAPSPAAVLWTPEDIANLQKASAKYPGGTVDRWRRIVAALHNKFTEEQVLDQLKVLEVSWKSKPPSAIPDASPSESIDNDWTPKQQQQLEQGLRELKEYKEKDKFTKVAAYVLGKSPKQCFERFKYLCAVNAKKKGC